ncbi:MBL fold metallo-hydrolase [Streptomyces sp. NPDC088732]|uniref:MBL fold metallo-hydrolase n=1 Tax=Streptomyces sp. NPDC088732 TaxID=3365879 RepID=UPI00382A1220
MLIAGFPAAWGTNCYVVAPASGEECIVVDPGHEATEGVEHLLAEHRLKPVAVVLTHGHMDHVASVVPVCGAHGVPAWLHPRDRYMLTDPEKALGFSIGARLLGELTIGEPDDVKELTDGTTLHLAGLDLSVSHTPGHTKGSVFFMLPEAEQIPQVAFTGDTLFAGAVGRTDMPGGDTEELAESLNRVCLPLDDSTVVLPGHGPRTTIGRERATNPYFSKNTARLPRRTM